MPGSLEEPDRLLSRPVPLVIDCLDNPLVVKADDIYVLVKYIGFEEGGLTCSPTYIIPGFIIENTDARG